LGDLDGDFARRYSGKGYAQEYLYLEKPGNNDWMNFKLKNL